MAASAISPDWIRMRGVFEYSISERIGPRSVSQW